MDHPPVSPRARAARASLTLPVVLTPVLRWVNTVRAKVRGVAQSLVEGRGPYARAFENLIVALVIFSIASIGVESIPGLPQWATRALYVAEIVVVAIFTFEYLLRLVAARNKFGFIFSYQGLVDLLAIAPFYVLGVDARWLRALRLCDCCEC